MSREEIAYQNKDITSKLLAENFKGKTFKVYGLELPKIRRVLPTNLPTVRANELRLDNLFELADGTAAIVDYESDYKKEDKVKYLNYLAGIASRYLTEKKDCPVLRMIVIYTGDIERKNVSVQYDVGAVRVKVEPAFLSELDSEGIFRRLKAKVKREELLEDEELMELIIQPLSYRKKEEKERQIRESVELAAQIRDRGQQLFALSGILVFADKIIDKETANKIRRAIEMTQVARIFEEEKQEALTQVAKIFQQEKQEALRQAARVYEKEKQEALTQAAKSYEQEKQEALTQAAKSYEQEKQEALTQAAKSYEQEKQEALTQAAKSYEQEKQEALTQAAKDHSRQIVTRMLKKGYSTEEIMSLVSDCSPEDIETQRKQLASEVL